MAQATTRFLGLDVHKLSISVAVAEASGAPELYGQIANEPKAVRRLVAKLAAEGAQLKACYEAGPCGYALQRQLTGLGVDCQVVAPSLIPRRPGSRIKTDSRDALSLVRLLRSGDLTPIFIPEPEQEALRDLVRARSDAKADLLRAQHRLRNFLLRHAQQPPVGVRRGSGRYEAWLNQLRLPRPVEQVVFEDYRAALRGAQERVRRLEGELARAAESCPRLLPLMAALMALRGIGLLSAVTIVAELGDLRRFRTAPELMAYLGLVPREYSSGEARHRGGITKTGNRHVRHVLVQAAHNYRHAPQLRNHHKSRLEGLPPDLVELAWQAQLRLHGRYRRLGSRIQRPKAVVAVARELAGFVWALWQRGGAQVA